MLNKPKQMIKLLQNAFHVTITGTHGKNELVENHESKNVNLHFLKASANVRQTLSIDRTKKNVEMNQDRNEKRRMFFATHKMSFSFSIINFVTKKFGLWLISVVWTKT